MEWVSGVTTVPKRREKYLPETLAAIERAGFPAPTLFVDGASVQGGWGYRCRFRISAVTRYPAIGVTANFWLGLAELYARNPNADWFAMFQDDVELCKNIRPYLELLRLTGRIPRNHWINLVTHPLAGATLAPLDGETGGNGAFFVTRTLVHAQMLPNGLLPQAGRGALALAFPRAAVQALLAAPQWAAKATLPGGYGSGLDGVIVTALNHAGWLELAHKPSLGIHTGLVSTLDGQSLPQGLSLDFPGPNWNALSF